MKTTPFTAISGGVALVLLAVWVLGSGEAATPLAEPPTPAPVMVRDAAEAEARGNLIAMWKAEGKVVLLSDVFRHRTKPILKFELPVPDSDPLDTNHPPAELTFSAAYGL